LKQSKKFEKNTENNKITQNRARDENFDILRSDDPHSTLGVTKGKPTSETLVKI
jgi:hypothetical protein